MSKRPFIYMKQKKCYHDMLQANYFSYLRAFLNESKQKNYV